MKPSPELVREWLIEAEKRLEECEDPVIDDSYSLAEAIIITELAAQWGYEQAMNSKPDWVNYAQGHADGRAEGVEQERAGWLEANAPGGWIDDLRKQAQQTAEPELPIGVASIFVSASGEREFDDWRMELPQGRSDLFTAAQMHDHYQAGVRAGGQDAKRYRWLKQNRMSENNSGEKRIEFQTEIDQDIDDVIDSFINRGQQ